MRFGDFMNIPQQQEVGEENKSVFDLNNAYIFVT